MATLLFTLTLATALACAVVAGVFFAFSNFVMRALATIAPAAGIAAMQSINRVVLNPLFLMIFVGTAAACVALLALSLWRWPAPGAACLALGGLFYLVGTFGVTMTFNVPRNETLARIDASAPEAVAPWRAYVVAWTRWNHVRTAAALIAAALLTLALTRLQPAVG